MPKIQGLLEPPRQTMEDSRKQIADITAKTSEILDITHRQVQRVDEILEDAASRAPVQLDRAEMVLDDAMGRAQPTVAIGGGGIVKALLAIHGVADDIKT